MATRITDKDVWKAADEVLQAGERPTIERIRSRLGRGSPNTVNEHLNQWYVQLASRIRDLESFTPATSIPEPVGQAARHFWEVAQSVAREESSAILAGRQESLDERERRLNELETGLQNREHAYIAQISALESSASVANQRTQGLQARVSAQESLLEECRNELRAARNLELQLRDQIAAADVILSDTLRAADQRIQLAEERLDKAEVRAALGIDRAREETKLVAAELKFCEDALEKERSLRVTRETSLNESEARLASMATELNGIDQANTELVAQLQSQKALNESLLAAVTEGQRLLKTKDEEHGAILRSLVANAASVAKTRPRRAKTSAG